MNFRLRSFEEIPGVLMISGYVYFTWEGFRCLSKAQRLRFPSSICSMERLLLLSPLSSSVMMTPRDQRPSLRNGYGQPSGPLCPFFLSFFF